ncbi:MAG: hypothetical protein [Siphoviridae sp. ct7UA22]|nr:MAG: hypothetical protein [Siphoviridae sp. ct7UA22]
MSQETRGLLEAQKVALEQLLQSQGWEILHKSLMACIVQDKKGLAVAGSSLDDLIRKNNDAARVQVMLTLVDLPANMLKDIEEQLIDIYEGE